MRRAGSSVPPPELPLLTDILSDFFFIVGETTMGASWLYTGPPGLEGLFRWYVDYGAGRVLIHESEDVNLASEAAGWSYESDPDTDYYVEVIVEGYQNMLVGPVQQT